MRVPLTTSAGYVQRAAGGASPNERQRGRAGGLPARGAAAGAALGTTRIALPHFSGATPDAADEDLVARVKRWEGRARRFDLRSHLWSLSEHGRVRKCGKVPVAPGGQVGLRVSGTGAADRVAGLSGLASCGSVWSCPTCAPKIAAKRAEDLDHVLRWAVEQGHTVAMMTLTLRHHARHPLRDSWDAASTAWGDVTHGRAWAGETEKEFQRRVQTWEDRLARGLTRGRTESADTFARREAVRDAKLRANRPVRRQGAAELWGLLGFARVVEATHGDNGWHPHLHVVLVFEGEQTEDCIRRFAEAVWPAWEHSLNRRGFTAVRDSGGLDIRCSTAETETRLAQYFTKQLALEAVAGHAKEGRRGGRTPFQILRDVTTGGDVDDLDLWQEWERASHGRRQLTWSQGLRAMAGLAEQEMTDEEIAEEEIGGDDLLFLPTESWREVRREAAHLLTVTEQRGLDGAKHWLSVRGVEWLQSPMAIVNSESSSGGENDLRPLKKMRLPHS